MKTDIGDKESSLPASRDLLWAWVGIGVGLGVVLLGTLVPVVRSETPRPDVALLIAMLTFTLVGILVGYHSPGETIREAAIAGALLVVLSFLSIGIGFELPVTAPAAAGALIGGLVLSAVGGWVGEVLQGTLLREGAVGRFAWPWILVGAVLGILLNVYTVFVLQEVLDLSGRGVLAGFLASFFVTAFFVAYFSPGFTIVEPALAALVVIAADMMLVVFGFSPQFGIGSVAMATIAAVVIALVGGYLGESAHAMRRRQAAANAESAPPGSGEASEPESQAEGGSSGAVVGDEVVD
jgi:hypothetical protein